MKFEDAVRLLKLKVKPSVADACRYLESRGYRFCVDFGYQNAVGLASTVLVTELERQFAVEDSI